MARLATLISAHPSAWDDQADPEQRPGDADASCHVCGQQTAGWHSVCHLDGDHGNAHPGNLALACPLCHLPQHLNRFGIDREATLIWLPELEQGAVMALARQIHLRCHRAGIDPASLTAPPMRLQTQAFAGYAAFQALYERRAAAETRLGSAAPSVLGAALLDLPAKVASRVPEQLAGLRLLPLGRLFRAGRDIYPGILSDWAAQEPSA